MRTIRAFSILTAVLCTAVEPGEAVTATAKPIFHLKLIVESLPEPDFLKMDTNLHFDINNRTISEPPKFYASESTTIGLKPLNRTVSASKPLS